MIFKLLLILLSALIERTIQENEFNLNFQQSDYELTFERMEMVSYNKEYFKHLEIITRKYNRTQPIVNLTFIFAKDFGNDVSFTVQAYKLMSNEYRNFPLRFAANACKALYANMAGTKRFIECGNFSGCPVQKDRIYHICNFFPNPTKFPPLVPNGEYKAEVQLTHFNAEMCILNMYLSISRPISIPH